MRLLGQLLLACLIIAALQGILAVLAVAAVVLIIWGLLFRTAEAAGLLLFFLWLTALEVHPWATIGVTACLAAILLSARAADGVPAEPPRAPPVPLLPPPPHRGGDG